MKRGLVPSFSDRDLGTSHRAFCNGAAFPTVHLERRGKCLFRWIFSHVINISSHWVALEVNHVNSPIFCLNDLGRIPESVIGPTELQP